MDLNELVVKVFGEINVDVVIYVVDVDFEVFFYEYCVDIGDLNWWRNFWKEIIESYKLMEIM